MPGLSYTRLRYSTRWWCLLVPLALAGIMLQTYPQSDSALVQHEQNLPLDFEPALPQLELTGYVDPLAGFSARVPLNWQRVQISAPSDAGVTVSFESPPTGLDDLFADYLMVDIQPGQRVEVLAAPSDEQILMQIAGLEVYRERIPLDHHPVAGIHLDLVVWQVTFRQPGYAVGIYAIGERREEARLERLLIEFAHSFELPAPPFLVTRAGSWSATQVAG